MAKDAILKGGNEMENVYSTLLASVWKVSLQAAAFAVVVWAVTSVARHMPARLKHALWVLVLVKLLIPPFAYFPGQYALWTAPAAPEKIAPAAPKPAPVYSRVATRATAPTVTAPTVPAPVEPASAPMNPLAVLWAAGAAAMLLALLVRRVRQGRLVAESVPAGREMDAMFAAAARRLGLRKLPALMISNFVSTPMLLGLFSPTVLLPERIISSCSAAHLEAMLLHELAHVKRRDMLVLWFQHLVQVVFFFHPAVWLAAREIRREAELSCDELVLSASGIAPKDYAAGYVAALRLANGAPSTVSLAMAEPFEAEKTRVERILRFRPARLPAAWLAAFAALAAAGIPTFAGLSELPAPTAMAAAVSPFTPKVTAADTLRKDFTIEPGVYKMKWQDLSPVRPTIHSWTMRRASETNDVKFTGLRSSKACWVVADKFIVVLDESRGTGRGFDVLYVLRNRLDSTVRAVDVRRGLAVRLKKAPAPKGITLGLPAMLMPADPAKAVIDMAVGPPGKQVSKRTRLDIAVYGSPNGAGLAVTVQPKDGWIGALKTSAGSVPVALVDGNGNGAFNDSARDKTGKVFRTGDVILLYPGGYNTHSLPYGEAITYGGQIYSLTPSPDGSTLDVRRVGKLRPEAPAVTPDEKLTRMVADGKFTSAERAEAEKILQSANYYSLEVEWHRKHLPDVEPWIGYRPATIDEVARVARQVSFDTEPKLILWKEPVSAVTGLSRRTQRQVIAGIVQQLKSMSARMPELAAVGERSVRENGTMLWYSPDKPGPGQKFGKTVVGVTFSPVRLTAAQIDFPRMLLPRQKLQVEVVLIGSDEMRFAVAEMIEREVQPVVAYEKSLGGSPILREWTLPKAPPGWKPPRTLQRRGPKPIFASTNVMDAQPAAVQVSAPEPDGVTLEQKNGQTLSVTPSQRAEFQTSHQSE